MKWKRNNNFLLIYICWLIAGGFFLISNSRAKNVQDEAVSRQETHLIEETLEIQKNRCVKKWIQEGDSSFAKGEFADARDCYQEALRLEQNNEKILFKLGQIEKALFGTAAVRYQAAKSEALADVAAAWNPPLQKECALDEKKCGAGSQRSHLPKVLRKLETIRIPALDFQDADVVEVIHYLERKSQELDRDGKGVNFVIKFAKQESEPSARLQLKKPATVSFSLRDVSLLDALDFIKKMTGIYYRIEEYAVVILPSPDADDALIVQSFNVRPDFFDGNLKDEKDVQKQLELKGIPFIPGSTANYFANTSKLIVRGTPEMLNLIANFVEMEQAELPQVQIETKFVEFSEDKLRELRFRWQVGATAEIPQLGNLLISKRAGFTAASAGIRGTTTDALTPQPGLTASSLDEELGKGLPSPAFIDVGGIIDGHGTRLLIDLMHRVAGGNLMAAPKITLQKGGRGTVRIAREFVYPRRYSSPTIPDEEGLVIPSNPEDFNFTDPKNIGVVLRVLVENVNPTTRLIDLRLEDAQVVDFDGFINYGNAIMTINKEGVASTLMDGTAYQPVFSIRRAQTNIQLRDGQTLVMGGFIRDDAQKIDDRVPVLGDIPLFGKLFQGKSDQSIKRNLIIMSTATLVKPDGQSAQVAASPPP